jgi:hypothetical protein
LDPSRDLGHGDRKKDDSEMPSPIEGGDEMDDDEAEEARKFFGVS